ncbi:MAG: helix-turn-helix domain-containing protein [Armatimonadetes bacterium]|nr:helix-turn-helix domain-containing protein [Armatimonadota bacterium]
MKKKYLSTKEAAKILGVKLSTLYNYIHNGTLVCYKPNNRLVFFLEEDLLNFFSKGRIANDEELKAQAIKEIRSIRRDR